MSGHKRKRSPRLLCRTEKDQSHSCGIKALTVFVAATVCYYPSIGGDFVFDDSEAIVRNPVVQNGDLRRLWTTDFWGRDIRSPESHKSYRPVTTLTFMLNHALSPRPLYFHLVNIVLHAIVSVLVLKVTTQMCSHVGAHTRTAFFAAILFAVHPIHSEAVANIVGRAELLMALFGLLSFSLYLGDDHFHSNTNRFAFVLLNALSTLSKEQGVTFLAICTSFDVVRHVSSKSGLRKARVVSCALLALTFCALRHWINGFQYPQFSKLDNPASFLPFQYRVINYFYIYLLNIWLLIFPRDLCFDYSMGCISPITNFDDTRLLRFCGYPALLALFLSTKHFFGKPEQMLTMSSVGITVISFLPASNIISVGFVIAERVLYVPSIGYCVIIGVLLHHLDVRMSSQKWKQLAVVICLLMISKCNTRSYEWNSERELYAAGISICPKNAKIYYNLAKTLADSGDSQSAERNYMTALELRPDYEQALNNIANIYERRGDNRRAIHMLQRSVNANGGFATAWMNLGVNQMAINDFHKAEISLSNAILLKPSYADAHFNLGNLYLKLKRYSAAEQCWKTAIKIQPNHQRAWTNLLVLLVDNSKCEEVETVAPDAMMQISNKTAVELQLAICKAKMRKFNEAEKLLNSLIQAQPDNVLYRTNMGVLYERWNKPELAISVYRQLSRFQRNGSAIERRIQNLQQQIKLLRM